MSDIQWREVSMGGWYDAYDNGETVRKTLKNKGTGVVYEVAVEPVKLPTKAGAIVAKPNSAYHGYVLGNKGNWYPLNEGNGILRNVPRSSVENWIQDEGFTVLFEGYE